MAGDGTTRDRLRVSQLFDLYVQAREADEAPDVDELVSQAGTDADELRECIHVYESMGEIADEYTEAEEEEEELEQLGRFDIKEVIGRGGGGMVYLARDPQLERDVALKVFDRLLSADRKLRALMLNESRSLARLRHPGTVEVFDAGEIDGRGYLVMEHVDGPTLAVVIQEMKRLKRGLEPKEESPPAAVELAQKLQPIESRVECLLHVARAISYAHECGVLHRDIKPGNLLFSPAGVPKLIDFGLAHMEAQQDTSQTELTTRLVGTPAYIAPEQVESGMTGADFKSDIFSFGVLCYEFLSLEHPFLKDERRKTLDAIAAVEFDSLRKTAPDLEPDLRRIVHHCLERLPDQRYAGMSAVASDLQAVLEHRPISVTAPSIGHLLALWARRNRRAILIGAGAVVAGLTAVGLKWFSDTAQDHSRVASALEAIELGPTSSAGEFGQAYTELVALKYEAARVDGQWLHRMTHPPLSKLVYERGFEISRLLAETVEREKNQSPVPTGFDIGPWRASVTFDKFLLDSPYAGEEAPPTQRLRGIGRFVFPKDLPGEQLFLRQVGPGGSTMTFRTYRPIEQVEYPSPGLYRFVVWSAEDDEEIVFETEVLRTTSWQEERNIEFVDRRFVPQYIDAETIPGGVVVFPVPGSAPPQQCSVTVPAFRVSRTVTCADFRRYCEQSGLEVPKRLGTGDEPARVTWMAAQAYCRSLGGRLPALFEMGMVDWPSVDPDAAESEWVAQNAPRSGPSFVSFYVHAWRAEYADEPNFWSRGSPADVLIGGDREPAAFRVAFTDDTRAAVLAAEEVRIEPAK